MLLVQSPIIFSQSLSGIKALDIPQNYILPDGQYIYKGDVKKLSGNIWEVFSDRSYNKTTIKPGGGNVSKVLQYLDKFYVMEVSKFQLHIVKDSAINTDGTFSNYSQDFGWISIENLLVWGHCLIDSKGLDKRVFIFKNENTDNYFNYPEAKEKNTSDYFQILYVFKEEKGKSLLAKSIRIFGNKESLDNSLVGWVSNDLFTSFNTILFAEPRKCMNDTSDLLNPVFFKERHAKKINLQGDTDLSNMLWRKSKDIDFKSTSFRFSITNIKENIAEVLVYQPTSPYQIGFFNKELVSTNIFYKGYCNLSDSQCGLSFERVLLLNKSDLVDLLKLYKLLLSSLENRSDSLTIINEFRVFFKIDHEFTNSVILESQLGNLIKRKFGFTNDSFLSNKPLKSIFLLENDISRGYVEKIREKQRAINSILNEKFSSRSFYSNANQYFWIQCSYFI